MSGFFRKLLETLFEIGIADGSLSDANFSVFLLWQIVRR